MREVGTSLPSGATLIATAPSDPGVIRNGGRLGARWAPAAALTALKRFTIPPGHVSAFHVGESANPLLESSDFEAGQAHEEKRLRQWLTQAGKVLHLGGGHDHVLPLLRAWDGPVAVLNLDAHCDTRTDVLPHSGNPFRLRAKEAGTAFSLHQLGIHPFANGASTLSSLGSSPTRTLWREECDDPAHVAAFLAGFHALPAGTRLLFSLDCDALAASELGAVSAPNPHGLSVGFVLELIRWYRQYCEGRGQAPCYGVYEFNPLYDSVSGHSARVVATLMHEMLKD